MKHKVYELGNGIRIRVVNDISDPILTDEFYDKVYNNMFADDKNNKLAGLGFIKDKSFFIDILNNWINTEYDMFFLYKDDEPLGTLQTFANGRFGSNAVAVGYIVSGKAQGKGYATMMLKTASKHLTEQGYKIVINIKDGNTPSEKVAAKAGYRYFARMGNDSFYEYLGTGNLTESTFLDNKFTLSNQWLENGKDVLTRVNPRVLALEEYVNLTSQETKPINLWDTYYVVSPVNFGLVKKLSESGVKARRFVISDKTAKHMFNPAIKGPINLESFNELLEDNLNITDSNDFSMILGNDKGEVKVKILDNILLVEDYNNDLD